MNQQGKKAAFKLKSFHIDLNITRMANVHYFEFTEKYTTVKDKHPFRELIYVDSGCINVEGENYSGTLSNRQLLIHKANEEHSLSCKENCAPNVIIIGFECDCNKLDFFSKHPVTLPSELIRILTEIIKEGRLVFLPPYDVPNVKDMKKRDSYPFGADQMIKLKLENLLIELIRSVEISEYDISNSPSDKKADDICEYILNHYEERLTLDHLCFLFNTNKTTLCNNFKAAYGKTIVEYINRLRIKKAKMLIRQGGLSFTQISSMTGFSSIHYFSKTFKQYENRSPSEYLDTIKSKLDI